MTFRFEEVRHQKISRDGAHGWHWRFKGVKGQGVYGSIVTNAQGQGAYLLADGDWPGTPGWEQRLTCIATPEAFSVPGDASVEDAKEALAAVLIAIGWGPRVG
jgi:hypothetical protein